MNAARRSRLLKSAIQAANFAILLFALLAGAKSTAQSPPVQAQSSQATAAPPDAEPNFDDKATGAWSGERERLDQAGISINAQLVLEGFENSRGGVRSGAVAASTFDLNLTVDTAKAFHLEGGEFYVDLEDHAGRNPSTALAGDLQVFDKLNSDPYLQVFELWCQQELFDGKLRLKLGKIDANTEFSVIDNGLPFLNSSTQVTPTIFMFPTTPDPMPGAALFFTPVKSWYSSFGAFYANRSETFGDLTGHPQNVQPAKNGMFLIGETGLRWEHSPVFDADGNLKLGVWGDTGTFTRLSGGEQTGAHGVYAIADQTLWRPRGDSPQGGRGVRVFLECGRTQGNLNDIDRSITGGATWTGLCEKRPDDVLGFSANNAHLSPEAALPYSHELALESLYRVQLCKWATLMPDLQYIIHPGGRHPDALVGTLQLTIQF